MIDAIKRSIGSYIDLTKSSYEPNELRDLVKRINRCSECNNNVIASARCCPDCLKPLCELCIHRKCHQLATLKTRKCSGTLFGVECTRTEMKKRCGYCRDIYYCSEECKATHWRSHRDACREHKMREITQLQIEHISLL